MWAGADILNPQNPNKPRWLIPIILCGVLERASFPCRFPQSLPWSPSLMIRAGPIPGGPALTVTVYCLLNGGNIMQCIVKEEPWL